MSYLITFGSKRDRTVPITLSYVHKTRMSNSKSLLYITSSTSQSRCDLSHRWVGSGQDWGDTNGRARNTCSKLRVRLQFGIRLNALVPSQVGMESLFSTLYMLEASQKRQHERNDLWERLPFTLVPTFVKANHSIGKFHHDIGTRYLQDNKLAAKGISWTKKIFDKV